MFLPRNVALQSWWANVLYRGAERIFAFHTIVEGDDAVVPGPILVFIRHVSQADTLLPVVYITRRHGIALRFVLKRELLWDPCLDIVGRRLPNVFVRRGSGQSAREIAELQRLMDDLGPREGVLIYPEGTRFTPAKLARVLAKLAEHPDRAIVARASRLVNVLPPHSGGPLGLLERNHGVDVVFCAHTGLEGAGSPTDLLAGGLVGSTVRVRFWRVPYADIPATSAARIDWLYDQWQRIDDWIGEVPDDGMRRCGGASSARGIPIMNDALDILSDRRGRWSSLRMPLNAAELVEWSKAAAPECVRPTPSRARGRSCARSLSRSSCVVDDVLHGDGARPHRGAACLRSLPRSSWRSSTRPRAGGRRSPLVRTTSSRRPWTASASRSSCVTSARRCRLRERSAVLDRMMNGGAHLGVTADARSRT